MNEQSDFELVKPQTEATRNQKGIAPPLFHDVRLMAFNGFAGDIEAITDLFRTQPVPYGF
jgi:hypothetical protein